ncbi:MAG: TVP38/TMEM64 family protein [Christensenellales bacterium]|jgi:uncharacterized membrane protein YdjX (TVP38/TMEM64 family)|nr:TVP38/TMEM64 family protein [Clostridiales bacterium]
MSRKDKQILFAAIGTVLLSLCVGYAHSNFDALIQIALLALIPVVSALFFISIAFDKEKLYKISILIVYFGLILLTAATLIVKSGVLEEVSSAEDIIRLIKSYGNMGKLVFILIQFLQVTFIPIPSTIVTAAGAAIYSPFEAIMLSTIGLLIGSLLAFFLGKTFGVRLVKWIVGEEALNKYYRFVKGKDKAMLIYMFIFPVFPDDVLCMFAGLTTMGYVSFIIVQLISRPINIAVTVFLVDYIKKIPFSGYGIVIWALVIIVFIVSLILMWKYAAKLEFFMLKGIGKLIGRPLIKDIDLIVAEEFLKKDLKKAKREDRKNQDELHAEVMASVQPDNFDDANIIIEDIKKSGNVDIKQLDLLLSKIINKKNEEIPF